ncbi:MAG: peptidoglycan DD-metalloendopeptidase family protein [bacterium]
MPPTDSPTGPVPPFQAWQPTRPPGGSRGWRVIIIVAAAVLAVSLLLWLILSLAHRPRPASPDRQPATATTADWQSSVVTVRPGEVLPVALARAGLPDSLHSRALAALDAAGFNFRQLRPGDSLTALHRTPGDWRVLYRAGIERIWQIDLGPTDRVGMPLRRVRRVPTVVSGSISSSLWDALLQQGEQPALVLACAEVLGWEVDFFTETQPGDSFVILVTRRVQEPVGRDSGPAVLVGYEPLTGVRYHGAVGDVGGLRYTDPDGRTDYYNPEGQSLRKTFLKSPLNFARVTSFFGRRFHPIHRTWRQHHGLDYAAPSGTPVSAVAEGRVIRAGWYGGYGNCVDISHPGGYLTRYGHLSRFGRGVRTGTTVSQGQVVGYVGSTGISTGPHLHFELHRNGAAMNPLRFDPPRVEPVAPGHLADFAEGRDRLYAAFPALKPRQ